MSQLTKGIKTVRFASLYQQVRSDQTFHNFRASRSGDRRILLRSETSCDELWSPKFAKGSLNPVMFPIGFFSSSTCNKLGVTFFHHFFPCRLFVIQTRTCWDQEWTKNYPTEYFTNLEPRNATFDISEQYRNRWIDEFGSFKILKYLARQLARAASSVGAVEKFKETVFCLFLVFLPFPWLSLPNISQS